MKIISWNIEEFTPHKNKIKRFIKEVINIINPDIIIIQELWNPISNYLLKKRLKEYKYRSKRKGGVKIFSKLKIEKTKYCKFDNSTGWDYFGKKGAVRVKIGATYIIGTHLQSGRTNKKLKVKMKQIIKIKEKLLYDIQNEKYIIIGDLNINYNNKKLRNYLLRTLNTWNVNLPFFNHLYTTINQENLLDYGLHSDKIILQKTLEFKDKSSHHPILLQY